ncbi:hypothetical protein CRG98_014617 [Punica granatum]|uniref:Uncharacterized protein n=1 Tax=Punica granatum TaxID=22663 RepID=A0A2I0KA45_PUNGR|nr:hypothetical protein CRG98_014617 [Punica granatum]
MNRSTRFTGPRSDQIARVMGLIHTINRLSQSGSDEKKLGSVQLDDFVRTQICFRRGPHARTYAHGLGMSTFPGTRDGHSWKGVATYHFMTRWSRVDKLPKSRGMGYTLYAKATVMWNSNFRVWGFYYLRAYIPHALCLEFAVFIYLSCDLGLGSPCPF